MINKIVIASIAVCLMLAVTLPAVLAQGPVLTGSPQPTKTAKPPRPSPPMPSVTILPRPTKTPAVDLACMQKAVEKRDLTISSAFETYGANVKNLLMTRASELKTAWGLTVTKDRKAAINAAWAKYRKGLKQTKTALNTAKNNAWNTFTGDRKNCRGTADDTSSAVEDAAL